MLFFSFWSDGGGFDSIDDGFDAMRQEPAARAEIASVVDLSFEAARHVPVALAGPLADVPLQVHARYQREEILAALDFPRLPNSFREGVFYFAERNVDAFFVTLKKSEADYSPTTMYADYPISRDLFHWESQSTTSVNSPTGQRYLDGSVDGPALRPPGAQGRLRHVAVPVPRPGDLRVSHGRSADRDHVEARARRCRRTSSTMHQRWRSRAVRRLCTRAATSRQCAETMRLASNSRRSQVRIR